MREIEPEDIICFLHYVQVFSIQKRMELLYFHPVPFRRKNSAWLSDTFETIQ